MPVSLAIGWQICTQWQRMKHKSGGAPKMLSLGERAETYSHQNGKVSIWNGGHAFLQQSLGHQQSLFCLW